MTLLTPHLQPGASCLDPVALPHADADTATDATSRPTERRRFRPFRRRRTRGTPPRFGRVANGALEASSDHTLTEVTRLRAFNGVSAQLR